MLSTKTSYELFAACAPGTEAVCQGELDALGYREARTVRGGVTFHGSLVDAAKANLWLRTANRILLRVGAFDAPGRRELAARSRRLDLSAFVSPGSATRLHVSTHRSRLYHTGLISEVFCEATGYLSASKEEAAPELFIRIQNDRCTISVDTSGELLHRRGYRQDVSHAPLRETLAAAMLLLAHFEGSEPFLDPMCGSGTIPIEAFLIATHRAPGLERSFALEQFPSHEAASLQQLRAAASSEIRPLRYPIFGSDLHAGALAAARRNAERARATEIQWERVDVARRPAPAERGLLVTNPPYGKRVGVHRDRSAEDSLAALGTALDGPFRHWRAGILAPAGRRAQGAGRVHRLDNGGIPVDFIQLEAEERRGSIP